MKCTAACPDLRAHPIFGSILFRPHPQLQIIRCYIALYYVKKIARVPQIAKVFNLLFVKFHL